MELVALRPVRFQFPGQGLSLRTLRCKAGSSSLNHQGSPLLLLLLSLPSSPNISVIFMNKCSLWVQVNEWKWENDAFGKWPCFRCSALPFDQKIANKSLQCTDIAFVGLASVLFVYETFTSAKAPCGKYGNGMSGVMLDFNHLLIQLLQEK